MRSLRTWLPAAPLLLYLAAFLVQPTLYAVKLSFTDTLTGAFPSVANFRLLVADGLFWRAVVGNVVLPIAIVAVEVAGGLAAAGVRPVAWLLPGRPLTFLTVVAADAWHVTPVVFLMLLAALTAIPEELGEAASLDGAEGLPVLSTYAYHQWSDYGNDGAAAAASSLLALLSVVLTLPLVRRGTAP